MMTTDLGCTTNAKVIQHFVSLGGKFVIDAGCGDMAFTRQLTNLGARVWAIDPDPVQAELNRAAEPILNIDFIEAGAERLSVPARSVDGIFFAYSLHHIPASLYPEVFGEVQRILKPDGFMIVIEPTDCPLNDVMNLFHNEDKERAAAQKALRELAVPAFQSAEEVTYHSFSQYDSFDQFADEFSNKSFNKLYSDEDVRQPAVREAFERIGAPDYRFKSQKRTICLKGLKVE